MIYLVIDVEAQTNFKMVEADSPRHAVLLQGAPGRYVVFQGIVVEAWRDPIEEIWAVSP